MDVLVAGGTGFVGTRLCRELHDRGHDVTAMARSPDGADLPDGADAVAGDVTDYDSIEGHFAGRDAVVNLVALSPLFKPRGGGATHFRVHRDGTEHCLRAAVEHGVDRFVQQSALDADPDAPTAYLRAKGEAEALVRDADLDWTVLRPSVVFGEGGEFVSFTRKLTPPLLAPLPGGGKTRFQPLHVAEMATLLANALEGEAHVGETYRVGGPEVLTLADVARKSRKAQGYPVHVLPLPMSLVKLGASVGEHVPRFPFGVDQYRSLRLDNTVPEGENDAAALGVDPGEMTTLAEYLGLD
ncbi:MAG: complex I NDUFA9 subunit family protein [Halobacteriaceae archaeon]